MSPANLRLYDEFAEWWPLLSAPEDYAEEAGFYLAAMRDASRRPLHRVLELGSGGGNNASHLSPFVELTLVEPSAGMLEVSRALNPGCEHIQGDMRTVRLEREFDAVFVHDAVCYMTTEADLARAIRTAWAHCAPGGVALFAPDHVRETFRPSAGHGGHDGDGRGLRYLEWTWDPDPTDTEYVVDYAYLLRESDGTVRVEHDRHVEGLFDVDTWRRLLGDVGFTASVQPFVPSDVEVEHHVFLGVKPDD